jgi:hypothetical protein
MIYEYFRRFIRLSSKPRASGSLSEIRKTDVLLLVSTKIYNKFLMYSDIQSENILEKLFLLGQVLEIGTVKETRVDGILC